MSMVSAPGEQLLRQSTISWQSYVKFSDELRTRTGRYTYDRGKLEILTVSWEHENNTKL